MDQVYINNTCIFDRNLLEKYSEFYQAVTRNHNGKIIHLDVYPVEDVTQERCDILMQCCRFINEGHADSIKSYIKELSLKSDDIGGLIYLSRHLCMTILFHYLCDISWPHQESK